MGGSEWLAESFEENRRHLTGRVVLQSRIAMGFPERTYLVRVFVDVDRTPAEIVTVYRTGKVSKYWSEEPS